MCWSSGIAQDSNQWSTTLSCFTSQIYLAQVVRDLQAQRQLHGSVDSSVFAFTCLDSKSENFPLWCFHLSNTCQIYLFCTYWHFPKSHSTDSKLKMMRVCLYLCEELQSALHSCWVLSKANKNVGGNPFSYWGEMIQLLPSYWYYFAESICNALLLLLLSPKVQRMGERNGYSQFFSLFILSSCYWRKEVVVSISSI